MNSAAVTFSIKRAPMLLMCVAAATGIVAALFIDVGASRALLGAAGAVAITAFIMLSPLRRFAPALLLSVVAILLFYLGTRDLSRATRREIRALLERSDSCWVVGEVAALRVDHYGTVATIRGAILSNGPDTVRCGRLLIEARMDSARATAIAPSQTLFISGKAFSDLRELRGGLGSVSHVVAGRTACTLVSDSLGPAAVGASRWGLPLALHKFREGLRSRIRTALAPDAAALCQALWIGDQHEFSTEFREQLRITGLSHIFALSGMNVAVVASLAWLLTGLLWIPRRVRLALVLGVLLIYCGIGGASPSLVRATLMAAIYVVGQWLTRRVEFTNLVFSAMFIELLFTPLALLTASFLLSYGSVFSIGLMYGPLKRLVPARFGFARAGLGRAVLDIVTVTVAAQVIILPLQAFMFERIPLVGAVANIVAIPGFTAIQILSMLAALMSALWAPLASPFAFLTQELTYVLGVLVDRLSVLPFAGIDIHWNGWVLLVVTAATALFVFASIRRSLVVVLSALLLLGNAVIWSDLLAGSSQRRLAVVDVENGDAILLQQGAHAVLVDTGPRWRGWSAAGRIRRILREFQITNLDALILTHPDNDHIGGSLDLIETVPIAHVLVNGDSSSSVTYAALTALLKRNSMRVNTLHAGARIELADQFIITVLSPDSSLVATRARTNQAGLVLRVDWESSSVLLTADVDSTIEQELLAYNELLDVDLLKIGHHGSKSSSCTEFLVACAPEFAVISSGRHNLYGHPSLQVLARLDELNIPYEITSRSGTVVYEPFQGSWRRIETHAQRMCRWWRLS